MSLSGVQQNLGDVVFLETVADFFFIQVEDSRYDSWHLFHPKDLRPGIMPPGIRHVVTHRKRFVEVCSSPHLGTIQSKKCFDKVVALTTAASPHNNFVVTAFLELRTSQNCISLDEGRQCTSHGVFQLLKVEFPSVRHFVASIQITDDQINVIIENEYVVHPNFRRPVVILRQKAPTKKQSF